MAANKRYTKYARYHSKPFECGKGTNPPGWYTWRINKFAETLKAVPDTVDLDAADMAEAGYTVLEPR